MRVVFQFVVAVLIMRLVVVTLDQSAYESFADVWNGFLDRVDRVLVRAIDRVEKW
jgi:hypothetical protein